MPMPWGPHPVIKMVLSDIVERDDDFRLIQDRGVVMVHAF